MATTSFTRKQDVYKHISDSASYGNLGLFIGTGFSKAVLNDDDSQIALSWGELLKKICDTFDVDYGAIPKEGVGFPELASKICQEHAEKSGQEYKQALSEVKREVARLTSWYPDYKKREMFSGYFEHLSPSWIITTNYDLVIETLLTGKSIPLGPSDLLTNPKNTIPVYHLHGIKTNPEDIVISQEDYVRLFRPNEYRQIKLALTLKESTVLLLGYGLGDVNVLTALDWSKNVFKNELINFPQEVIQVLKNENPSEKPYLDQNGIWIVETDELSGFFDEYVKVRKEALEKEHKINKMLSGIQDKLNLPSQETIDGFIDDADFRKMLIRGLADSPIYLASGFISLIDKCLTETWVRSEPKGAFEGYNQNLILILDVLTGFTSKNIPPALFQTVAYGLEKVAYYVGKEAGKSFSAARTWENRKRELTSDMIDELASIARQYSYTNLKHLLDTIV